MLYHYFSNNFTNLFHPYDPTKSYPQMIAKLTNDIDLVKLVHLASTQFSALYRMTLRKNRTGTLCCFIKTSSIY